MSRVRPLRGCATVTGLSLAATILRSRLNGTTNWCSPFFLRRKIKPTSSLKYSVLPDAGPGFSDWQNLSSVWAFLTSSRHIFRSCVTACTALLRASACLICVPGRYSTTKSNSDRPKDQRSNLLLFPAKLCMYFTPRYLYSAQTVCHTNSNENVVWPTSQRAF